MPRSLLICVIILSIVFVVGCLDDPPVLPPRDNPWDPDNPGTPRAPDSLRARAVSEVEILFTWRDRSGNEDGFRVYESIRPDTSQFLAAEAAADSSSARFTGCEPETEYSFFIESYNTAGASYRAGPAFVSMAHAPPLAPINLSAAGVSDSLVLLTWQDVSNIETIFEVESSFGTQANFQLKAVVAADDTSWLSGALQPQVMYYFRLRSGNEFGYSPYTEPANIFPGE